MRLSVAAFLLVFGLVSQDLHAQTDKRIQELQQDLQKERAKLVRENDPVDRTKTQIKIAEILLEFVGDTIRSNKLEAMQGHLAEYLSAIQDAHAVMKGSGRDAYNKPGGFKDLEIALRRHVRQLEDLGGALTWEQRDPVEKARNQATEIRDELIRALFGAQSAESNPS